MSDHNNTRAPAGSVAKWAKELAAQAEHGDECIDWPFSRSPRGYGQLTFDGKNWRAHRFVLHIRGELLPPPLVVAHSCGRPCCVNPRHLRMATDAENHADTYAHGTATIGRRNGSSKLTEEQVRLIRSSPLSGSELARRLGVSQPTVSNIINRRIWAWLD